MKNGISEIIGQAVFGDGAKGTAYRALRPLWCASCSNAVAEGDMFTRERQTGQGLRLWPRCQACVPFALETAGKRARSPLLQNLLTPVEQQSRAATVTRAEAASGTNDEQRRIKDKRQQAAEAMRQRLGPALERARRSRNR
jgi:hypothetical protein